MTKDKFPAIIRKSGSSKTITVPVALSAKYSIGQSVYVEIEPTSIKA